MVKFQRRVEFYAEISIQDRVLVCFNAKRKVGRFRSGFQLPSIDLKFGLIIVRQIRASMNCHGTSFFQSLKLLTRIALFILNLYGYIPACIRKFHKIGS